MVLLFSFCALGLLSCGYSCSLSKPDGCAASPVVPTDAGPVQGFDRAMDGQKVSSFLTIPFAEPPVGALRFHYPMESSRTWSEPYLNLTHAAACPQQGGGGEEDCLYLNVYTPRKAIGVAISQLFPVMFWIFGGGFSVGDLFSPSHLPTMYDGGHLAGRHELVVVSHNYRLNVLGFNTYTKGLDGQTGTQAMEDQRMAMRWTHNNIQAFGGDPASVTIFGESAGAFSVIFHLVSEHSWPFFSRAISESGTSELSWFFQPRNLATEFYESWAEALACPSGDSQLACLQGMPASNFSNPPSGLVGRSPSFPSFSVGPVIDGSEHGLRDVPATLVRAGKYHKVPLILGSNEDGGSVFEPLIGGIVPGANLESLSQKDVDLILDWSFTHEDQAKITSMYRPDDYGKYNLAKYYKMIARVMRDLGFMCSDRVLARQWRDDGLKVYLYTFNFDFGKAIDALPLGSFHGSELPFIWRSYLTLLKVPPTAGAVQWMADIMSCQWATFAYTGSPSGSDTSQLPPNCEKIHGAVADWPVFSEDEPYYSLHASHWSGGPTVGQLRANNMYPDDERPSNAKCDMWDTVSSPWRPKSTLLQV